MAYVHKDSQGTPLEVGQQVAYNLSGDVVPGEIVKLTPSAIHVLTKGKSYFARLNHVSKVKNSRSVLVLDPPTMPESEVLLRDALLQIKDQRPWGGYVAPNKIADSALHEADQL